MGIFSRLAALIKANLNDLISKSEDPEKMLNQIVQDMTTQLAEAKTQVASAIADEMRLAKQVENEQGLSTEWERRAMLAVRANDDALAKEALARKKEHSDLAEQYRQQALKQKAGVDQLKLALRVLNNKIEEAKRKKGLLIARKKRA
ncbi:MAG TPA: PspA/IM30 family protein, partial [Polyangiaceae bacterium]|nr:PspA/IM30 family protein [Polyangiaceae bacterium]